jgi:hypothetical protein
MMNEPEEAIAWNHGRYVLFDSPDPTIQSTDFEKRYKSLLESVEAENPFLLNYAKVICKGKKRILSVTYITIDNNF